MRLTQNLNSDGKWWPAARAALETYRKQPHTSTGESPLFLFTGQEPTYDLDHLLPIVHQELWNQEKNRLDLSQLRVAHALARKNTCLARLRNKVNIKVADHILQPGDMVFRKNFASNKGKLHYDWVPGFRVTECISKHTFRVEHIDTKVQSRVARRNLRWADPVSALLSNSNVDVFPGRSKLYFSADDLRDLNWGPMLELPEPPEGVQQKMTEAARDRSKDDAPQVSPTPAATPPAAAAVPPVTELQPGPSQQTVQPRQRRARERQIPRKFRDYVMCNTVRLHELLCTKTQGTKRRHPFDAPAEH
jgi:hypothetical protein